MNDFWADFPERNDAASEGPLPTVLPAPARKGWPWLAWPVIVLLSGLFIWTSQVRHAGQDAGKDDGMEDVLLRMQGRYVVGAARAFGAGPPMLEQLRGYEKGSLGERLRFAVLAGELAGPREAEKSLAQTTTAVRNKRLQAGPGQGEVLTILGRLYHDYDQARPTGPSVGPAERQKLVDRLGWFGELALAPPPAAKAAPGGKGPAAAPPASAQRQQVIDGALRTFWATLLAGLGALALGGLGLVLLVVFLILAGTGRLRSSLHPSIFHGGVYAETFAVWLLLFAGLSLAATLAEPPREDRLLWSGAAMLASLLALGWPVLRGVPWSQVRQDLGLHLGRRPLLEPLLGIGCYVMSLPLVGLGLIAVLVLVALQQALAGGGPGGPGGPLRGAAHPIVEHLAHGSWRQRVEIFVLASVVAPLVEETMFRGVLYRHLREASRPLRTVGSFLVSATVVSFLFAAVHPQGWLAVPLLMALAFGFALAREWRGSLLPCMVGHGLNNGLVLLAAVLALGD